MTKIGRIHNNVHKSYVSSLIIGGGGAVPSLMCVSLIIVQYLNSLCESA